MIKYICDSCRKEFPPELLYKVKLDEFTEVDMCEKCRMRIAHMIRTGSFGSALAICWEVLRETESVLHK